MLGTNTDLSTFPSQWAGSRPRGEHFLDRLAEVKSEPS